MKKGQTHRHMYRKAGVRWSERMDRAAAAPRPSVVLTTYHCTSRQVESVCIGAVSVGLQAVQSYGEKAMVGMVSSHCQLSHSDQRRAVPLPWDSGAHVNNTHSFKPRFLPAFVHLFFLNLSLEFFHCNMIVQLKTVYTLNLNMTLKKCLW